MSFTIVIPLAVVSIAVSALSAFLFFIPFAGMLLSIGVMLYNAYLNVLYLKEAHGFDLLHAALVVVVTIVVFAVVFVLLLSTLFLSVLGAFSKGAFTPVN